MQTNVIKTLIIPFIFIPQVVSANSASENSGGFLEDSSLSIMNRNYYFNRDFRKGQANSAGNGYSETWAHGLLAFYRSGYTQGTVGVGVDAVGLLGLRLDSGRGRTGQGGSVNLLPADANGDPTTEYSKLLGAVKLKFLDTEVKLGDVFPTTPVVHFGDSRLLPQSFKGITATNNSFDAITINGGRLHAMSQPQQSETGSDFVTFYAGQVKSSYLSYLGGEYKINEYLTSSLYTSKLDNSWRQYYFGSIASYPIDDNLALTAGLNVYRSVDDGRKFLGEFSTNIWSVSSGIVAGAHSITMSYQQNNGDNDFDYLRQSDSIYLNNSIQYSDFNSPKEQSVLLRYDINLAQYGIPGLTLMARYGKGWNADYSNANSVYMRRDENGLPLQNQHRWERDIEARYVVQSGPAKDLSIRVRQATTRASKFESDLDEIRIITEYPLSLL